jgi:putative heme-binding domain-containing protein
VGKKNFVRLIDANGKVLREAAPPRNDVAQRIEWDLADLHGAQVRFEATDGDAGKAYAWLAFGRFKPELPELAFGPSSTRAVAADLAGRFKLVQHRDALLALLADRNADVESRAAAAKTLAAFRNERDVTDGFPALSAVLASAEEPDALREKIAVVLGSVTSPTVCRIVADAMPSASSKLQQSFATALSANRCGTIVLIDAIQNGKASPYVLRDKATVDRLRANAKGEESAALDALLAKLPAANVEADKLIAERRANYKGGDIAKGAAVFQTNCAVCHQIGKVGNLVGPQLDGVGGRGLDRIIEDILDPNRNVDRAFRLSIVTLKDGGVASGLLRREEGGQMVLADIQGKESSIAQSNVVKRDEADTSLMPPAFGQTIAPADFNDLLAYLLSQRPNK